MKFIKKFFRIIRTVYNLIIIAANKDKLSNSKNEQFLEMGQRLKRKEIDEEEFSKQVAIFKKNTLNDHR